MSERKSKEDVLKLVLQGKSVREMSQELNISDSAIKYHLTRLYKEHEVKTGRQLISKLQGK